MATMGKCCAQWWPQLKQINSLTSTSPDETWPFILIILPGSGQSQNFSRKRMLSAPSVILKVQQISTIVVMTRLLNHNILVDHIYSLYNRGLFKGEFANQLRSSSRVLRLLTILTEEYY